MPLQAMVTSPAFRHPVICFPILSINKAISDYFLDYRIPLHILTERVFIFPRKIFSLFEYLQDQLIYIFKYF